RRWRRHGGGADVHADLRTGRGDPMSTATIASPPVTLAQCIAALRAQGTSDLMPALLADAADPQVLVDELGALLGLPVQRMQSLAAWQPQFECLPFAECARRRCAVLHESTQSATVTHFIVTDPFDTDTIAWARTRFGAIEVSLASAETFDAWL